MDTPITSNTSTQETTKKPWNSPQLSKLDLNMTEAAPSGPFNDGDGGFSSLG
jgi:hypothetical protein